jgi:Mrp family chromosome partitioning ATPase
MPEKNEQFVSDDGRQPGGRIAVNASVVDTDIAGPGLENTATVKLEAAHPAGLARVSETPRQLPTAYVKKVPEKKGPARVTPKEAANIRMLQEQCRRLCLELFARKQDPIASLGFTSAIGGEGKSFLALTTARILARDSIEPVTLVECNWEHPTLHEYFGIPATPGLAEWLSGRCSEQEIRYQVDDNLTIIPAGNGAPNAVKLLKQLQRRELWQGFRHANELVIVDLPAIITSSYGSLAARLVDAAVIVVRSEVIPGRMLTETCNQLKDASVCGIILNQENSHIPRWLRQLL